MFAGVFVIASEAKQSSLSFRGEMDCFASLAMTVVEGKMGARAALGGQVEAARALERGVGSLLFSADVNSVTSDAE
jgi:hypothetical protein